MSDLLPLVVATLKDKIAIDAQEEISKLRNDIRQLMAVEIMHTTASDDVNEIVAYAPEVVVVYASGSFADGKPGENPNVLGVDYEHLEIMWGADYIEAHPDTWQVDFEPGAATCQLSDLRKCQLYVGGGLPSISFGSAEDNCIGWVVGRHGGKQIVRLCFYPNTTWVEFAIIGGPDEDISQVFSMNDCIEYLVENTAASFPETTIEFRHVSFVCGHVHGPLKRLLPPKPTTAKRRSSG